MSKNNEAPVAAVSGILAGVLMIALTVMALSSAPFPASHALAHTDAYQSTGQSGGGERDAR